jgi:hypothetical protein
LFWEDLIRFNLNAETEHRPETSYFKQKTGRWIICTTIVILQNLQHWDTPKKTNSLALSPRTNYTDWAAATCRRNLVPTFVDRGMSRGQLGGSPTVVNLSFLDRSRYFSFK